MPIAIEGLRPHLQAFDFTGLFVEGLGWDHYQAEPVNVQVNGREYSLKPVAEKAGFVVYECTSSVDNNIPQYPIRRKIESQVTKRAFEHLIIFVNPSHKAQVWQWVKRESGKPAACREYAYVTGRSGDHLLQRLQGLAFAIEEEASLTVPVVTSRVRAALDVEKVTKRFYERFRIELTAFAELIDGIAAYGDRDWYASLMLNRMMFVYFVQKQGFLDGDINYLRNRLNMVQQQSGSGRFQQFYGIFLLRLFHEGLGQPEAQRAPDLSALLGKVPFLNGGLFDVHDLEHDNPDISIPDEAFERVFNFFDGYRWHLDERPYREDNEINPDVLGYIFEKYVNQKQMGAYYTKEDITGYISGNTVIPFLFDAARKKCPVAFGPDGGVWRLLRDDPDRYIYPAVGHGITWNAQQPEDPESLHLPFELPEEIAVGLHDISRRSGWNRPAPDEYALPTETWREVVARRQRYAEVRARLASATPREINDVITLNLDIERFARDVIAQSEGPELLRAFWHAMRDVSILDPTCGSGAFLFAALNVLEPLYTACLEGMRGFLVDLERTDRPHHPDALRDFRDVLKQLDRHHSERYFILKSIVLNNLYGVDIMEEAVDICKLRLFLKLVAQLETYDQIEPLPDIDFNIRAGNTLVGFSSLDAVRQAMTVTSDGQHRVLFDTDRATLARIEEDAEIASRVFSQFRRQQTILGGEVTAADKAELRQRLDKLDADLDRYMATEYGIDLRDSGAYDAWRAGHQPFHWFVEFYGIMSKGGFDVVIGNPPYLEFREVDYKVRGYASLSSGAIHALCIERSAAITGNHGCMSMIVPLALPSTQRMTVVQNMLEAESRSVWYANFAWRPAKLFDTVSRALTIFAVTPSDSPQSFSTNYQKWTSGCRDGLFDLIRFAQVPRGRPSFWVPKISVNLESSILHKLISIRTSVADFIGTTGHRIFYRSTGGLYWKVFTDFPPDFSVNGHVTSSSRETSFSVRQKDHVNPLIASLSSDIFWWWYTVTSNLRDLNPVDIMSFPVPLSIFSDVRVGTLAANYLEDIVNNSAMLVRRQKQTGRTETQSFKIQKSKFIIEEIDGALANHYGFTEEELDFIINYDIKYRMGRSNEG